MREENTTSDEIICALISFMIMSFYIFETASWGRYVIFGITILVTLIYAANNGFKIPLVLNRPFHVHVAAFAIFALLLQFGRGIQLQRFQRALQFFPY